MNWDCGVLLVIFYAGLIFGMEMCDDTYFAPHRIVVE